MAWNRHAVTAGLILKPLPRPVTCQCTRVSGPWRPCPRLARLSFGPVDGPSPASRSALPGASLCPERLGPPSAWRGGGGGDSVPTAGLLPLGDGGGPFHSPRKLLSFDEENLQLQTSLSGASQEVTHSASSVYRETEASWGSLGVLHGDGGLASCPGPPGGSVSVPWAELKLRETHGPGQDGMFVQGVTCAGPGPWGWPASGDSITLS